MSDNQTINQRLKNVRQSIDLTQKKFADRIALSFNYLAEMELGKKIVNDRIIKLVSMEFGIDEHWLRTGEGVMFSDEADARVIKLISLFKTMSPQFQEFTLKQINDLAELYRLTKQT